MHFNRFMKVLVVLAGILLLVSGGALAQTTSLDVLMTESTGTVSMQLPSGWSFQEGLIEDYPISLVFGDSGPAISVRASNMNTDAPKPVIGNGGVIAFFDPLEVQEIGSLDQALIEELFLDEMFVPGRLVGPNAVSYGGLAGLQIVARNEETQEEGLLIILGLGDTLALVSLTSEQGQFDALQGLYLDMLATLSVANVSVSVDDVVSDVVGELVPGYVSSAGGEVSLILPDGWLFRDLVADEGLFLWGDTEAGMQTRYDDYLGQPVVIADNGGFVLLLPLAELGLTPATADPAAVLQNLEGSMSANVGYELVQGETALSLGDAEGVFIIVRIANEYGYIGVVVFDDDLGVVTATGTLASFEANRDILTNVLLSIRAPAESPVADTVSAVTTQTVSGSGAFSVEIPEGWVADTTTGGFEDGETIYLGSDEAFLSLMVTGMGGAVGAGGVVLVLTGEYADPSGTLDIHGLFDESLVDANMEVHSLVTSEVNGVPAKWGRVADPEGYWVVYDGGSHVVLMYLFTSEGLFAEFDATMQAIVQSARFP